MPIQHFQLSWKIPSSLKITKKICHNGMNIEQKNALTWYESWDLIFQKNLLKTKPKSTTSKSIEHAWKKPKTTNELITI
jgi:hypothetical protein